MKSHAGWLLILAGLAAGIVSAGCTTKQVREEGALGPSKATGPGEEQSVRRGELGMAEPVKKEAALPPGDIARQGPGAEALRPSTVPPPPPRTAALEPAGRAPVSGQGLSGETRQGLNRIHFDLDQAALSAESREILAKNAAYLRQAPAARVQIEGHCDERGTAEYNLALGERRAKNAVQYLADLGIAPGRMSPVSYGKEAPLDPRHNEEAWAQNRRAEFVVLRP